MTALERLLDVCLHPRKRSFALDRLDLKLWPHLGFRRGFFIEAGANNGRDQSNTLFLEKYYGWRGLLVEPIPQLAEQCRQNRPSAIVENCALVPFGYGASTVEMHYCNLMSLVKGAMKSEDQDLAHIRLGSQVQQLDPYEVRVPACTLTALLEKHRVNTIDLFSLDVEGYELQVLQGLDLNRFAPRFLLIEARFRGEVEDLLHPRYEVASELSEHDVLYRARE